MAKNKISLGFDFNKMEIIWFDVAYVFGNKKHADSRHGYPATSHGPIVASLIFFAIISAAVVLATW